MRLVVSLCAIVMVAQVNSAPTLAAQTGDVRSAILASLAAWNNGDVKGFASYYAKDARGFNLDNGALITGVHQTMLQAAVTAGFRVHVEPRDIDIKIYGNVAVTVAYLDGSITLPGGEPRPGTWRYSETRVKIDGIWKVVQYHISPMAARASRR